MKITANILGPAKANYGLGNQMFQVATIMSYCADNNFECFFSDLSDEKIYGSYIKNIFRKVNWQGSKEGIWDLYQEPSFGYTPLPKFTRDTILQGYFQSYKYFEHNENLIRDTFCLSEEDEKYLLCKYGDRLNKKSLSVHIRRGDYLNHKDYHYPLYESIFYKKALEMVEYDVLFVFSDDKEWCKNQPLFMESKNTIIVDELDYLEMILMSMCQNNIIANSTFSWWGAWLNKNKNKMVVCPKTWFGDAATYITHNDLIPNEWKCI